MGGMKEGIWGELHLRTVKSFVVIIPFAGLCTTNSIVGVRFSSYYQSGSRLYDSAVSLNGVERNTGHLFLFAFILISDISNLEISIFEFTHCIVDLQKRTNQY